MTIRVHIGVFFDECFHTGLSSNNNRSVALRLEEVKALKQQVTKQAQEDMVALAEQLLSAKWQHNEFVQLLQKQQGDDTTNIFFCRQQSIAKSKKGEPESHTNTKYSKRAGTKNNGIFERRSF